MDVFFLLSASTRLPSTGTTYCGSEKELDVHEGNGSNEKESDGQTAGACLGISIQKGLYITAV
jgi:hypothetical protein